MEITQKTYEDTDAGRELVLTMRATAAEVDAAIKEYFDGLKDLDVPGFRRGKAPKEVMEAGVGGHEQAYTGAAEKMMNTLGFKTIDDADIIFISDPEFNVDGNMEDGKPFTFTVSGLVPPVVQLTSYDPVKIEMPPEEATEKEIDKQLQNLREYYHSFKDITDPDHVAQMGDYAMLMVSCSKPDGTFIRGLIDVERLVGLGKDTMPPDFDAHIVGAKVGDTLDFDFDATQADGTINANFGEATLHANVEVKGFRECVLPEINDEFALKVGAEDVEDMRRAIKNSINMEKRKQLPKIMEDRCVAELIKRLDGEIPEYYVNFICQDVSQEYLRNLEKEGSSLQEHILKNNIQKEDLRDQISTIGHHRAACDLALEALFAHLDMEVTPEDVDKQFAAAEDAQDARAEWESHNRMADFRKMIRQNKAAGWLVRTAEVEVVED